MNAFSIRAPRTVRLRRWSAAIAAGAGLLTLGFSQLAAAAAATPTLSASDAVVTEASGSMAHVRVSLAKPAPHRVTVDYRTVDGTARTPADYTTKAGTLRFVPGQKAAWVQVPIRGDRLDESTETFSVRLYNPSGARIVDRVAQVKILDNDPMPSISVKDVSAIEPNGGATKDMSFPVYLSAPSGKPITVGYSVTAGTATSGSDYVIAAPTGELAFPAGATTRSVTLSLVGDDTDETNESVQIALTSPENATLGTASATGTIVDNDGPDLSIDNMTVTEGGTAVLTVTLARASAQDVTFGYSTSNGTATAVTDYTATSGSKTISAGDTTAQIAVPTVNDQVDEADETFSVDLTAVENANLVDGHGVVTIDDNDNPMIRVEQTHVSEGGTAWFEVELSAKSPQDITFRFDTHDGTATTPADYQSTYGWKTIPAGVQEVRIGVPTVNDLVDEVDETFDLQISQATDATISIDRASAVILDNDGPNVSVGDVTVTEGQDAVFTVSLSGTSVQPVKVRYETERGTAGSSDFQDTQGYLTIPAGHLVGQVTVKTVDDAIIEPDETFKLELEWADNATIIDGHGIATIKDNDAPTVSISDATVTQEDIHAVLTVTLSKPSTGVVTVLWATADDSAVAPGDYLADHGTVTFNPGETTKTVAVEVKADQTTEPNEYFYVNLSGATNAVILDGQGIVTIPANIT